MNKMTTEKVRDETPAPSGTVEYGRMQIPVAPGEIVYDTRDVISDGGNTTGKVTPVTIEGGIFSPRNPTYTDGDGVRQEYPGRIKIHY